MGDSNIIIKFHNLKKLIATLKMKPLWLPCEKIECVVVHEAFIWGITWRGFLSLFFGQKLATKINSKKVKSI